MIEVGHILFIIFVILVKGGKYHENIENNN